MPPRDYRAVATHIEILARLRPSQVELAHRHRARRHEVTEHLVPVVTLT
jgi:hypothetical protein